MDCFIGEFITKFLGKKDTFKNFKEVIIFILNLIKKIKTGTHSIKINLN